MFKTYFPLTDTTIYEYKPDRNTGADQILELTKRTGDAVLPDLQDPSETWSGTTNSRILMKFDINTISQAINNGEIGQDARFYLQLRAMDTYNLPIEYTIDVLAVSQSYSNGTGFYNNNPQITNGVSWTYRSAKSQGVKWPTSSFAAGSTGSWNTTPGGAAWYTGYQASQSFNYQSADTNIDVTNIVHSWLSGSISNDGFIIKLSEADESSDVIFGSIKFFGKDTHTVYIPRLNVYWDSSNLSGTASFTEITTDDFVVYLKNLRNRYYENEKARIRVGVRERYPTLTYSTSSIYTTDKRLPITTYYSVLDAQTDEVITAFNDIGTKLSCDSNGNYFIYDMNNLLPERRYRFIFKSVFSDGSIRYIDNSYLFEVRRLF